MLESQHQNISITYHKTFTGHLKILIVIKDIEII